MKKVLLKDIAKHVGVSTALVSYVLNGQAAQKQVNKETADKILNAARKLDYRPNQIAKSLKLRKTHTVGLVVADINYRFTTGITSAIESEAKKNDYTVIYGSSDEDAGKFAALIDVFINRQVDGLILVPVEGAEDHIRLLQKSEIPFVLMDRYFPEIKTNCIAIDNYSAAYKSTEYLIRSGHKRIAFINYKSQLSNLQDRNRGYKDALKDHKIKWNAAWMQEIGSGMMAVRDVQASIDRLLDLPQPCDAIFFATDTLALHGLKYLNKRKIKVPDQLSVLSFDESEAFDLFYCPVTHATQPLEEMGKLAFNTLIQLIKHNKINMQISLESDLTPGKSCREQ